MLARARAGGPRPRAAGSTGQVVVVVVGGQRHLVAVTPYVRARGNEPSPGGARPCRAGGKAGVWS